MGNITSQAQTNIPEEVQAYMDLKFGMFIHFGVNTYTNQE